ncbi:hypothetical protein PR048_012634 [Dryococelus australis]|uniref:Uncharacterized protein n=1 Tax=Dryococelus australis TaxID=614101 RepID=A0ABQ9HPX7_9NEOP|nr:hypothetical protein PR048_012634 [Dryococelus australis]
MDCCTSVSETNTTTCVTSMGKKNEKKQMLQEPQRHFHINGTRDSCTGFSRKCIYAWVNQSCIESVNTSHIMYRKESMQLIPRLTNGALAVVKKAGENRHNSEVLHRGLMNGPLHVFKEHTNCLNAYCSRKKDIEVLLMSLTSVWPTIMMALDPLILKADKLVGNHTTNQSERYKGLTLAIVERTKDVCVTAGFLHVKGPLWHLSPAKYMFGHNLENVPKMFSMLETRLSYRHEKDRQLDTCHLEGLLSGNSKTIYIFQEKFNVSKSRLLDSLYALSIHFLEPALTGSRR